MCLVRMRSCWGEGGPWTSRPVSFSGEEGDAWTERVTARGAGAREGATCPQPQRPGRTATPGARRGQSPSAPAGEGGPAHRWTPGPRNCEGRRRSPRKLVREPEAARLGPAWTPQIPCGARPSPSAPPPSRPAGRAFLPSWDISDISEPARGPRIPALPVGQTQDGPSYEAPRGTRCRAGHRHSVP